MRKIIFRGKRADNGEWAYGDLIHTRGGHPLICAKHDFESAVEGVEVEYYTVGWYTGLQDKNSKKIFEGDIVNLFSRPAIVKFDTGKFVFERPYQPPIMQYGIENFCECQIIGNIHDNPELLKGGN